MSTDITRGETEAWIRVATSADFMTAYQVREFVRSMDEAGIPDNAEVTDRHSYETRRFTGLVVRAILAAHEGER